MLPHHPINGSCSTISRITVTKLEMRAFILIGFFASLMQPASAQDSLHVSNALVVLARQAPDSVVLRWAPVNFETWDLGNSKGYSITRYLISRNGTLVQTAQAFQLSEEPVKLRSEEKWENLVQQDKYAAIAAQAFFGAEFSVDFDESNLVNIVNKAEENEQRFAFALFAADMSVDVARASGLYFVDKDVKQGEKYLYRIETKDENLIVRGSVFVDIDRPYLLTKPFNFKCQVDGQLANLRWEKGGNQYTAFIVERSTDGKKFTSISETPLTTLSPVASNESRFEYAVDSLVNPTFTYYYRVKGITPFGEIGPPSEPVAAKAILKITQVPFIEKALSTDNKSLLIQWNFPEAEETKVNAFVIERGAKAEGKFLEIGTAAANQRTFLHLNPEQNNYYRIRVDALNQDQIFSPAFFAQLVDSLPPTAPQGLKAIVDTSGQVTLTWTEGLEADIYGYRVYRSNNPAEEMTQLTVAPVHLPQYTDSVNLHSLNEFIYYAVIAVDVNQNQSPLSSYIQVALPDKIPPSPPVFLPCYSDEDAVNLSWIKSPSPDVREYKLFRRYDENSTWELLRTISNSTDTVYVVKDEKITKGKKAYYTIICVDDAGLQSHPADPISSVLVETKPQEKVKWKSAIIKKEEKIVLLSWMKYESVRRFQILKSVGDGPFTIYKTIGGDVVEIAERINPGDRFRYKLVALLINGSKSELSDPIIVEF